MSDSYTGSCLCGEIKFEVIGEFENFYLCHCRHCQKDSGSAHSANLFSTTAKLVWKSGQMKVKTFNLPSTRHVKAFCQDCSSAMPSLQMNEKLLVVPAGSLDTDVRNKIDGHLFCSSRAKWDLELEKVKQFEKFPE